MHAEMECFEEECGWVGDRCDAMCPTDDPDDLRCPGCGTRLTESEEAKHE